MEEKKIEKEQIFESEQTIEKEQNAESEQTIEKEQDNKNDQIIEKEQKENKDFEEILELKINIYPKNKLKAIIKKYPLRQLITSKTFGYSFDINRRLIPIESNVPLLAGFYKAYINHNPIRIKPDDIWLLIVQAFSHYVNQNSEELRNYFVNFEGKKTLEIEYGVPVNQINKKILEDFSKQIYKKMVEYLGKELMDNLTPDFTTTDYNSTIVSKLSIMGAFKNYNIRRNI